MSGINHSYNALLGLLDSIIGDQVMGRREKRRRLKQVGPVLLMVVTMVVWQRATLTGWWVDFLDVSDLCVMEQVSGCHGAMWGYVL